MAATGTASIDISLSTALAATLMPTLVSQRRFLDAMSLRFGHNSSISAISRKTLRNTGNRITPRHQQKADEDHGNPDHPVALADKSVHELNMVAGAGLCVSSSVVRRATGRGRPLCTAPPRR